MKYTIKYLIFKIFLLYKLLIFSYMKYNLNPYLSVNFLSPSWRILEDKQKIVEQNKKYLLKKLAIICISQGCVFPEKWVARNHTFTNNDLFWLKPEQIFLIICIHDIQNPNPLSKWYSNKDKKHNIRVYKENNILLSTILSLTMEWTKR